MNLDLYETALRGPVWREMSHFGQFRVSGDDASRLLHHLSTNDINGLPVGQSRETVLISARARVLDLLTIVRLEPKEFLVITSPNRRDMFAGHARQFILFRQDVLIEDVTGATRLIGVFQSQEPGEAADALLEPPPGSYPTSRLPGAGYLLQGSPPDLPELADNETYNVLRVEAGVPVTGLELTEEFNPWEAGQATAISLNKGCYNGQEVVARLNTYNKVKQKLVGLKFSEAGALARQPLFLEGKNVGLVTSPVVSPRYGPIGLGYVRNAALEAGGPLQPGEAGGGEVRVVPLPFSTAQNSVGAVTHE